MTDLRQTPKYAQYMKLLGWDTISLNEKSGIGNYVYIRKIPLIGNIAKIQRPVILPTLEQINTLHQKYNLAAVYIEPTIHNSSQTLPGFQFSKTCFLPPKTIHINLQQSEKRIFSQMKSKTRYNVRLSQKRGVVVEKTKDIDTFVNLWQSSTRARCAWLYPRKEILALWKAVENKVHLLLLLAYNTTLLRRSVVSPLAGIMLVQSPTTAYYMYAASTKEGNKLFAPTLLVWEAIKLAKKARCKLFDFEGIYDERYPQTKSWKGFSRFKEGFGGNIIKYPKTLVRYYNPLLKILSI